MTDTNWDGKITREMFDLSQVETDYGEFKTLVKRYLINCLVGNAHLTGDGTLLENFDEIIEEVIKPIIEYEFTLLDNSNIKLNSKDISKYVIFKFNKEGTPYLSGLSFWTKRLANILKKMETEMFMNEKGIMLTVPSWPDTGDITLITKSFNKKPFFVICLPKSQKGDTKAGTTGIPPHSINYERNTVISLLLFEPIWNELME